MWSVQKFRPYLHGRHFTIVTDHHVLCWLYILKNLSGYLGQWIIHIQEYNFTITYKYGKKQQNADALSRCTLPTPPSSGSATNFSNEHLHSLSTYVSSLAAINKTPPDDHGSIIMHQLADTYCRHTIDRLQEKSRPPNACFW